MVTKEKWIRHGYSPLMHYLNCFNMLAVAVMLIVSFCAAVSFGVPTNADELAGFSFLYIFIVCLTVWLVVNCLRKRPGFTSQWCIKRDEESYRKWEATNLKDGRR